MKENSNILLFDGVCNLCNASVIFVIKHDQQKVIKFASLQSNKGKELLASHQFSQNSLNSFVYLRNNAILLKSTAALYLAKDLAGLWQLFFAFIIIPRPIRDFVYSIIANNRYRWFGKSESCMIPSEDFKDRFLM
jgi:predicted DCC family thiol-disulfide oxidoreductase YuxK